MSGESNKKRKCVVCYQDIDLDDGFVSDSEGISENYISCNSNHVAHKTCIQQWLLNSKSCPVCHNDYSEDILNYFSSFIKKTKQKKIQEKEEKDLEEIRKQELAANKRQFDADFEPEIGERFQNLLDIAESGEIEKAIKGIWDILDEKDYEEKDLCNLKLLFTLGKLYYESGKSTLGIRQLMKLVKLEYSYPLAFYYLGRSFEKNDVLDKAKWAYDRSLHNIPKLMPQYPELQSYAEIIRGRMENILKKINHKK